MSILGKRIKYLREKNNFSQKKVATELGISNVQLSRYESGDRKPEPEMISQLAEFFDVTTDYLLGRTTISDLPELNKKDERDIARKLEGILDSMDSDTALAYDGEPLDEHTKELVRAAIESNLKLTKQLAKKKFTPKKHRNDQE